MTKENGMAVSVVLYGEGMAEFGSGSFAMLLCMPKSGETGRLNVTVVCKELR